MSTTYVANIVAILAFVLPHFGISIVDPNSLAATVAGVFGVIASAYVFIGRWRAGGISLFGIRKD